MPVKRGSTKSKSTSKSYKNNKPKLDSKKNKQVNTGRKGTSSSKSVKEAGICDKNQSRQKYKNQALAIVLFSVSILLLCVVIIPGENVWRMIHNFILGVFGVMSILWPVLLSYISITTALEKPASKVSNKVWMSVVVICMFCSAIYLFMVSENDNTLNYFQQLMQLYNNGTNYIGSGLFGGLIGIPLLKMMGVVGARILIVVMLFASMMFLTGTTLLELFKALHKPVDMVVDGMKSKKQDSSRTDELNDDLVNEDIDKLPLHPVHSSSIPLDDTNSNDKLRKLKQAFKIEDDTKKIEIEKDTDISDTENSAALAAKAFLERQKNQEAKKLDSIQPSADKLMDAAGKNNNNYGYSYPPLYLLEESKKINERDITGELQRNGEMLVDTLNSFNVQTKIVDISRGPAVTRYELQPASGVKISKITNLADDIALNLAAYGVRIEAPIPGKAAVGIEVPNKVVNIVKMRELVSSNEFNKSKSKLSVILGKDISGNITIADLAKMPHLLIAGSTGSGKSVCINSFIISLLYKATPDEVRLLMIDPKVVELGVYNGIPHLLVPVVTDPRKAAGALNWAVNEMLNRYKIFADNNVRDLTSYNRLVKEKQKSNNDGDEEELKPMPQIVIIIDELADLMMAAPNEVEDAICRLAQMARAAGMHLVIATQRPSVDVITGIIKANIPSRIALAVSSQVDSRTILDMSGAEKLLGRGDMLFAPIGSTKPLRVQGCYVTDKEIESVINFVKEAHTSEYDTEVIEQIEKNAILNNKDTSEKSDAESTDPMMPEAIKCVVELGQASTSLLQRRLRLGYARAGRLMDEMEQMGIVGPHEGSKPRQVLLSHQQWLEMNMRKSDDE